MKDHLVIHHSRSGSDLALTVEESILLDHLRDGTPYIPKDKFFMVENALERLGRLSLLTSIGGTVRERGRMTSTRPPRGTPPQRWIYIGVLVLLFLILIIIFLWLV